MNPKNLPIVDHRVSDPQTDKWNIIEYDPQTDTQFFDKIDENRQNLQISKIEVSYLRIPSNSSSVYTICKKMTECGSILSCPIVDHAKKK